MLENTIGKRIQTLRKEREMTQKQLADAVGVTPQAVSKWETDESCPDISALPLLAGALGVSVDALLGGEGGEVKTGVLRDANADDGGKKEKPFKWDRSAGRIPAVFLGVFILLAGVLLILMKTNAEWFGEIGFWDVVWPSAIIFVGLSGCC
ncbi:MAG: helix-turn-helix transcriptional regulator, partial [Clostridia bacterium]|nr:helix-turn-helix transcriptional regulator [Clostridia bacterium]